jgi:hypothetical protein
LAAFEPSGDELRDAEQRIAWVLEHPGMSSWLKNALRTALDCDPVQIVNDLEILRTLLPPRTDALVKKGLEIL